MQASSRPASGVARREQPDRVARRHLGSGPDQRGNRLVGRTEAVVVQDAHDAATGDRSSEVDDAPACGTDDLTRRSTKVDATVPGQPRARRRLERPDDGWSAGQRPSVTSRARRPWRRPWRRTGCWPAGSHRQAGQRAASGWRQRPCVSGCEGVVCQRSRDIGCQRSLGAGGQRGFGSSGHESCGGDGDEGHGGEGDEGHGGEGERAPREGVPRHGRQRGAEVAGGQTDGPRGCG